MDYRLRKPGGKKYEKLEDFEVTVSHDGKRWKVYYYSVDFFREDLPVFGKFLELLEERGEEVSAIIPNTGWVKTSILLGSSFQGVKGFAVIARNPKSRSIERLSLTRKAASNSIFFIRSKIYMASKESVDNASDAMPSPPQPSRNGANRHPFLVHQSPCKTLAFAG